VLPNICDFAPGLTSPLGGSSFNPQSVKIFGYNNFEQSFKLAARLIARTKGQNQFQRQ
jgi:hypothetical protein